MSTPEAGEKATLWRRPIRVHPGAVVVDGPCESMMTLGSRAQSPRTPADQDDGPLPDPRPWARAPSRRKAVLVGSFAFCGEG